MSFEKETKNKKQLQSNIKNSVSTIIDSKMEMCSIKDFKSHHEAESYIREVLEGLEQNVDFIRRKHNKTWEDVRLKTLCDGNIKRAISIAEITIHELAELIVYFERWKKLISKGETDV